MKISWNWLNQLVDLKNINIDELAKKLTLAGFEVENIINNPAIKDTIFEIDVTANRADINSIVSVAKEITAICNIESNIYKATEFKDLNIQYKQINYIDTLEPYIKVAYSYIENIQINTSYSPTWLQNYLIGSDIKPTNNILDIIAFINLKWGQSTQLWILDKSIINSHTNLLDFNQLIGNYHQNLNIKIDSHNIDNYTNKHTNIILIGYIKKKPEKYSIQPDLNESYKKYLNDALIDGLSLIKSIYKINTTEEIIYEYTLPAKLNKYINCKIDKINQILGSLKHSKNSLSKLTIVKILQRLNFIVQENGNELQITIPEDRQSDIQEDIDIVEEIGRVYGFNYFISELPILPQQGNLSNTRSITKKIRYILRSIGLHEVLHFSFRPDLINNKIQLVNPLNKDQQSLRLNLIENLIESNAYNINKANETFEVFEIGKVFVSNKALNQNNEFLHLAGILGNNTFYRSKWHQNPNELSWFQAKGHLEEFLERIQIPFKWSAHSESNYLTQNIQAYIHPRRTCYIQYNQQTIGLLSQLNNRVASHFGISYPSYIFEISIDALIPLIKKPNELVYSYQQYSNYPKITRDISISINKYQKIQKIIDIINTIKEENKIIESINIFDEYSNTENTKKIGLRITYRSQTETLTNKIIEKIEKIFQTKINQKILESKS